MSTTDRLRDLLKQATTERSHYYVADCCREAIARIDALELALHRIVGHGNISVEKAKEVAAEALGIKKR